MNLNLTPTNQIYIPLKKPGGFESLEAVKAHHEVVEKATSLRAKAEGTIEQLREQDRVDIGATGSDDWTDLASAKGHVIVVGGSDEGRVGFELRFNPDNNRTSSFVADLPDGKLTQGADVGGNDGISPTFKWEEDVKGEHQTTYFKFDDKAGMLTILDPDHKNPAILKGVDPHLVEGGFVSNPMTIFTF